jgi:hypothetical protein
MTPEEFSAIKARVAIATPGPWYWRSGNHTANLKTADSGGLHTKAIRTKVLPDGRPFIDDNVLFATGVVDGDPYWKARLIEANKKRPVLSLALELVGSGEERAWRAREAQKLRTAAHKFNLRELTKAAAKATMQMAYEEGRGPLDWSPRKEIPL